MVKYQKLAKRLNVFQCVDYPGICHRRPLGDRTWRLIQLSTAQGSAHQEVRWQFVSRVPVEFYSWWDANMTLGQAQILILLRVDLTWYRSSVRLTLNYWVCFATILSRLSATAMTMVMYFSTSTHHSAVEMEKVVTLDWGWPYLLGCLNSTGEVDSCSFYLPQLSIRCTMT